MAPPARLASRAGTELALTLGAVVHLHRDKDFRPVPLGVRAGYQFDAGPYLGAAGEWSLSLPNDRTSGSGYYQLAGELAYDYSPLANVGAIPFARAGYTSTFQSHCEHRKLPAPCEMTRDGGVIGQLGIRALFRNGHFISGLEFHYQFGALESVGFRFSSGVRF